MLLVTGITGHTGKYFIQELMEHKYKGEIRCLVRETSDTSLIDTSGLNIEKVIGDLNDKSFIKKITLGVETVLHIYNIHHSSMIVQSAIENDVKRVILVHTTGIYSQFKQASQKYQKIEEEVLNLSSDQNCPTKITILRPTMIYGDICDSNMSKFIKIIDKLRVIPVIDNGKSLIQPVNARDLGKAYFTVLMNPDKTIGKNYDLSGEIPLKMIEVLQIISDNLHKKTLFISIPLKLGVFFARAAKVVTIGKIDYVEKVQRMAENRSYIHIHAKKDFNFTPITFENGIKLEICQYMKRGNKKWKRF